MCQCASQFGEELYPVAAESLSRTSSSESSAEGERERERLFGSTQRQRSRILLRSYSSFLENPSTRREVWQVVGRLAHIMVQHTYYGKPSTPLSPSGCPPVRRHYYRSVSAHDMKLMCRYAVADEAISQPRDEKEQLLQTTAPDLDSTWGGDTALYTQKICSH
jgi:hypothetical protein